MSLIHCNELNVLRSEKLLQLAGRKKMHTKDGESELYWFSATAGN
jgi:hypothetical protein